MSTSTFQQRPFSPGIYGVRLLAYDGSGNLIEKTGSKGAVRYSYDPAGRLAGASMPDGTSVNYSYDAYGRKIFQEESFWQYNGGDREDKQLRTQKTAFFYQGTKLIKEYTGSGDPLAEYYYGNNRVIARKMFGYHGRKAHGHDEKLRTRGGLMYYHYDALGNVMDLTDHLGQGVVKYRWDAFGGMFAGTLAPYSRTGLTGKEYDQKTGLVFFGSRWYDPLAGRFTMPDSFMGRIAWPSTLNTYAYALNNPVRYLDPTGHDVGWGSGGGNPYDAGDSSGGSSGGGGDYGGGDGEETGGGDESPTDNGSSNDTDTSPSNDGPSDNTSTNTGNNNTGNTDTTNTGNTGTGNTTSGSGSGSGSGNSSGGGGGGGGGGSYTPPPPPTEGGNVQVPVVVNDVAGEPDTQALDEQQAVDKEMVRTLHDINLGLSVAGFVVGGALVLGSAGVIALGFASVIGLTAASVAIGLGAIFVTEITRQEEHKPMDAGYYASQTLNVVSTIPGVASIFGKIAGVSREVELGIEMAGNFGHLATRQAGLAFALNDALTD